MPKGLSSELRDYLPRSVNPDRLRRLLNSWNLIGGRKRSEIGSRRLGLILCGFSREDVGRRHTLVF